VDFALHEPQALNNGMIAEYNHPTYGLLRVVGNQIRFSDGHSVGAASVSDLPPPLLGQHSHEILREIDYSPADIERFERAGVVKTTRVS